ncbi:MAG: hypothetical protein R2880_19320 [Deinococcales bacterium]
MIRANAPSLLFKVKALINLFFKCTVPIAKAKKWKKYDEVDKSLNDKLSKIRSQAVCPALDEGGYPSPTLRDGGFRALGTDNMLYCLRVNSEKNRAKDSTKKFHEINIS